MRNILGHILLCFAIMLCLGPMADAFPQGNDYDLALDKYARICDRCVELRTGVESGQSVSMAELKSLLAELSSLRKTLSSVSGKMSATQSARFEAIKNKYLQEMTMSVKKTGRSDFSPIPNVKPVTEPVEVTSRTLLSDSLRFFDNLNVPQTQYPRTSSFKIAVLADAGIFPVPSYGATAVATWKGLGAYASFRSDFRKNEYSYVCTSAGDTEYGRIWASGSTRASRTVAAAGFAMFTSRRFGFRAGAGVTSCTRCWEDVSGQWAKVKDKSFRNLAADAGMFLTFNPLIISVGIVSDFSGRADLQFGIGVRF